MQSAENTFIAFIMFIPKIPVMVVQVIPANIYAGVPGG